MTAVTGQIRSILDKNNLAGKARPMRAALERALERGAAEPEKPEE